MHNLVLLKGKGEVDPATAGAWTDKYCGIIVQEGWMFLRRKS